MFYFFFVNFNFFFNFISFVCPWVDRSSATRTDGTSASDQCTYFSRLSVTIQPQTGRLRIRVTEIWFNINFHIFLECWYFFIKFFYAFNLDLRVSDRQGVIPVSGWEDYDPFPGSVSPISPPKSASSSHWTLHRFVLSGVFFITKKTKNRFKRFDRYKISSKQFLNELKIADK